MGGGNELTVGSFETEEKAALAFDAAVAGDPRFSNVYAEVPGIYSVRSPYDDDQAPRIDRVLIPSKALRDAGWSFGPIGVEVKASGKKLGRPVAQAIDYVRASFEVLPGFHVPLSFVFVFPCGPVMGDLEAIMTQSRVGACNVSPLGELVFFRGTARIISLEDQQRNHIPLRKVGSR